MSNVTTTLLLDKLPSKATTEEAPHSLQFIPATIGHDGPQEIEPFFTRFVKENKDKKCLEAALVGRPLEGEVMSLPEGHSAVVLQAGRGDCLAGDENRDMRAIKKVDGFTYWNYDRVPSEQDPLKQALQWIDLAKAFHKE